MVNRTLTAAWIGAALAALTAGPAVAYPTAIWNVPTGKVTDPGNLHIGVYTFVTPTRSASFQDGLLFGALPGFTLGEVSGIGALELGVDTTGTSEVFDAKLQLFSESEYFPAFSVGGLNLANTTGHSENVLYDALTKELGIAGFSLGTWTLGFFSTMPSDPEEEAQSGWMGGVSYQLGSVGLSADYMSGTTSLSGINVYLGYEVASNVYLNVGHYFHYDDRSADLNFVAVDIDLPTDLFGQESASQED